MSRSGSLLTSLGNLFRKITLKTRRKGLSISEVEELRAAFKARYHNFKLLLSANNKALELMAELEQALRGNRTFGMSFIRAHCTAISVNVFRMIKNLNQLAPGKYEGLHDSFRDIQEHTNEILSRKKESKAHRLVLPFSMIDKEMADQVGSKMANIGEVKNRLNLPVPDGFVVTSLAYQRFFEHNDLQAEIDRRLQSTAVGELDELYSLSADIQQLIIRAALPEELEQSIMEAHKRLEDELGEGIKVSMRSSALGEDAAGTSFAGQYRSELNVSREHLIQAYKEIVASKYSLQAISYRLTRGILDEDVAMCVGCMAMVNAAAGGVTYSRNPLNIRDESININSVWGLPKSVVDGSEACDLFVVSRTPPMTITQRSIKTKDYKFVCYPDEGVCRMELTGERNALASLDDERVIELAEIALRLEDYYGSAQDIEWALDQESGTLYVLQCRPLKQTDLGDAGGERAGSRSAIENEVILEGGVAASPGVACGAVFVVRKNSDVLQFPQGAILVTAQAHPRWAALLSRAAGVVTEQGGAAGHLANVAREFCVPGLFGIEGACERLKNDEIVTVDADGGAIYRGRAESLLEKSAPGKNLMEGSPVYELLSEVIKHISPLNLLDPDSMEFRPQYCRTFHDITRFCHEQSVKEMFNFGKEHHFSERASKQLVCNVPMQWWFINLDDGFREDVAGKFVPLENIVSIPVLALWEGINAVPWQGPPPVDAKGFMSVLMEATANPALDPSMPSHYVNRNYFMISKNFCSLSSRFGFHFSTIETLVGDRPGENYVSFTLKGGAADYNRRLRRAVFISSILEEFDFRAEVKEDGVFARIEGYGEEVMKEKLRILGYMLMHTRQLDMIMSNDASYNQHREKMIRDIREVVIPVVMDKSCVDAN